MLQVSPIFPYMYRTPGLSAAIKTRQYSYIYRSIGVRQLSRVPRSRPVHSAHQASPPQPPPSTTSNPSVSQQPTKWLPLKFPTRPRHPSRIPVRRRPRWASPRPRLRTRRRQGFRVRCCRPARHTYRDRRVGGPAAEPEGDGHEIHIPVDGASPHGRDWCCWWQAVRGRVLGRARAERDLPLGGFVPYSGGSGRILVPRRLVESALLG